ncbi:MAG: ABC transporter permease [Proteobacteria bacterium]|nr:ABC transporter permease [Pseudomonadota bacterium]
MTFTTLWSDVLIYILLFLSFVLIVQIVKQPHLRQRWRKILYKPLNITAVIVLSFYVFIGLLDTIHFKETTTEAHLNTNGMVSVLDKLLMPLIVNTEKTYSAPFATHAFVKENIKLPDDGVIRDYPRLKFGGAHLKDTTLKWQDIGKRFTQIILQTLILWAAFSVLMLFYACRKHKISWEEYSAKVLHGQMAFPWRAFLGTIGLIIFFVCFTRGFMDYYHILGTNEVGEDVLYQTLKSIRTGLVIGTLTTLITLPFAILFGIMAGYFRGRVDDAIQYVYTTLSSIPAVLLIAAAVLVLQVVMDNHSDWFETVAHRTDARLLALCAILGITSWTGLCRLLRGETLKICEMDFVLAARSLGSSHGAIILKHLLPNVFHIILITVVLDFSGLVLAEAVLSYVGVGVDPASFSWGTMINSARLEMARQPVVWWCLAAAFVFMFVLVLAANIFSDAVRDAFDPRAHLEGNK